MADPAQALGLRDVPPHDYGGGSVARWTGKRSSLAVTGLTAVGALIVGFMLAAGLSAAHEEAVEQNARKDQLVALIGERQAHIDELSDRLDGLRDQVAEAEAATAAGVPALQASLSRAEAAVGLTALVGPGLRVTLADSDGECPDRPANCRIQDGDVQEALNTLFAAGAEAVAINGERVITTTAVRSAGQVILVNYRVLSAPYVLEAIGEPETMSETFLASELSQNFAVWTDAYGLGFAVESVDELTVPEFTGSVGVDEARPVQDRAVSWRDAHDGVRRREGREPRPASLAALTTGIQAAP